MAPSPGARFSLNSSRCEQLPGGIYEWQLIYLLELHTHLQDMDSVTHINFMKAD